MSQFFTPTKQQVFQCHGSRNINKSKRDGDWVCYNCNNLNYSFRKKCNRCKIQTREQNQQIQVYYYQYLPQNYYINEKQNFPSLSSAPSFFNTEPQKENKKIEQSQFRIGSQNSPATPKKQQEKTELPSVSPLVKRYNRHQNNSTQESKNKGLFQNQAIWENINLNYQDDYQQTQTKDQKEDNQQEIYDIQRVIQQFIL